MIRALFSVLGGIRKVLYYGVCVLLYLCNRQSLLYQGGASCKRYQIRCFKGVMYSETKAGNDTDSCECVDIFSAALFESKGCHFFVVFLRKDTFLPRSIIYNLNPSDNTVFSTMAGNFAPDVQFGAAWWLNDHIRGIEAQLDELMETGSLAASVGMLTDSRSFTSFVRHEYYRRILCRKLGRLIEDGFYPDDIEALGEIVTRVCYENAERFFINAFK